MFPSNAVEYRAKMTGSLATTNVWHAGACKIVAVIANLEALDDFRFLG